MKILVFEWLLGGGLQYEGQPFDLANPILRQGLAMGRAIAADFEATGCEVVLPVDARLSADQLPGQKIVMTNAAPLPQRLRELAAAADWLFLIAPESGGRLAEVVGWVEAENGKLLSPSRKWVELCADKHRCQEVLRAAGVTVPRGILWRAGENVWPPASSLPAIIKPNDGCGGEDLREVGTNWGVVPQSGAWRIESRIPGQPLSVLVLAGPAGSFALQPTIQHFAGGRLGDYVGGELVTDPAVARLAQSAVSQVLAALSEMSGIFGIDLVVDRSSGTATVIEVNPRLTSSYLGLRQVYAGNLAASLLGLYRAGSHSAPELIPGRLDYKWRIPE